MFNSDLPIKLKKYDILDRARFADSLSKAISGYHDEESLVLGLYGPWGSGKTSIINMAIESLNSKKSEESPIILNFNPWNYSDQNQLIAQFFRELARVLPTKDENIGFEKAAELLDLYATAITPFAVIPNPSLPVAFGQVTICKSSSKLLRFLDKKKNKSKSLQEIKDDLNSILQKQKRKIVIVIDDIDRLNNTEIRQIFQLIKSLADFKNTLYFLAFDKDVVVNALAKVQEGDGYEYLEKVVQVPFAIPAIPVAEVQKFLFASLDGIIKDLSEDRFDQMYWASIFHSGINMFFETIRDVNRFINIFRFKYSLLKDDINAVDLIAITAIQVFLPDLHLKIRDNKTVFVDGYKDSSYGGNKKQELKEALDGIIQQNISGYSIDTITGLLNELFPKLSSILGNLFHGAGSDSTWRRIGRLCSEDNFDIYFQFSMPSGKISKSEIERIISDSDNQEQIDNAIIQLKEDNRIAEFLERLLDYSEVIPTEKKQNIICTLLNRGDDFPKDDREMLGFGNDSRIGRVGYFFTKELKDKDKCFEIFKNAMTATENSLHTLVDAVIWLGWDHGKWTKQDPKPEEEQRVNGKQLAELQKIVCQKIEIWANGKRLIKHPELLRILWAWEYWDNKQVVEEYVQKAIESDAGLIEYIEKFPSEIRSQGMGQYGFKISYEVNIETLKKFVDIDEVVKRLREILSGDDFEKLSDKQKDVVKLVLDTFDGKIKPYF